MSERMRRALWLIVCHLCAWGLSAAAVWFAHTGDFGRAGFWLAGAALVALQTKRDKDPNDYE